MYRLAGFGPALPGYYTCSGNYNVLNVTLLFYMNISKYE